MSQVEYASPLRYPGGKSKLSDFLIRVIEANGLTRPRYVEPYAGGCGAGLHLLFDEFVERVVINDADKHIQAMWRAMTQETGRFVQAIHDCNVSARNWKRQRELYQRLGQIDPFEVGFATFFLNRTSRSGIILKSGPIGGKEQDGPFKIDARFDKHNLAERVKRIGRYAHRIDVSGFDGLSLLRSINQRVNATNTFVFIDPPYYDKGRALYLNSFDHSQHIALADFMKSRVAFKWVMTYDNVPQIRAMYRTLNQKKFDLSYSAATRRVAQELLIYPDDTVIDRAASKELSHAA